MENWKRTRQWLFDMEDIGVKVVSHRGKFTSSVMENTSTAFLAAIGEGADIVEMDLDLTKDGILVGHHDNTMKRLFHLDGEIGDYTWKELQELPVYNYLGEINVTGLETFEQILESLKNKTILTLDKCWDYWEYAYEQLVRYDMVQQTIFKFYIEDEKSFKWAQEHPDCMFIPMVKRADMLELVKKLGQTTLVPAVEIIARTPQDSMFSDKTINWLKKQNMKVLCNSLSLAKRLVFGAGFDDLRALKDGGDEGWGVLVAKGIDMIQTDWPMEVGIYLKQIGRRG